MIQLNQQKTQQLEHSRAQALNLSTQSLFFSLFSFFPWGITCLPRSGTRGTVCARQGSSGRRLGKQCSAWPHWLWGVLGMTPFSFSPMWFHTSTPQVHFELQVQMNAKSQQSKPLLSVGELSLTV